MTHGEKMRLKYTLLNVAFITWSDVPTRRLGTSGRVGQVGGLVIWFVSRVSDQVAATYCLCTC